MLINEKARPFVSCLVVSRDYGFNDFTILTHSWHESAGFKNVIGRNNYWGIKVPSTWKGSVVEVPTHEYEPVHTDTSKMPMVDESLDAAKARISKKYGVLNISISRTSNNKYWCILLPQRFIDFPTVEMAIVWYCQFIERLYSPAYEHRDNPPLYFEGLVSGKNKYATDPQYVSALKGLYQLLYKDTTIVAALVGSKV